MKRSRDGVAAYDRALALNPNHVQALGNRGNALSLLNRHEDAIASYDRALALEPNHVETLTNRGIALLALKRHEEAIAGYDQALAIKRDHVDALFNRGNAARLLKRSEEAQANYRQALALQLHHPHAFNGMAHCALAICDWATTAALAAELLAAHCAGRTVDHLKNPWMFLGFCDDPALQLEMRQDLHTLQSSGAAAAAVDRKGLSSREGARRLPSGDFRRHATANLVARLLELHDRARFDVLGVAFSHDDGSEMRGRLVASVRPVS